MTEIAKKENETGSEKSILIKIRKIINKIEESLLIFFLSVIIIVSVLQFFLSFFDSFFKSGFNVKFVWFESLLKYAVLWLGMIAASIATSEKKHIKIDLIGRFAKGRLKSVVLTINSLFAAAVTIILAFISIKYIALIEYTSTDPSPFLSIPRWILITALPLGFGLMGIKFIVFTINYIYNFIKKKESE